MTTTITDEQRAWLARDVDQRIAATLEGQLCLGCPPAGTESKARCTPCPRRSSTAGQG